MKRPFMWYAGWRMAAMRLLLPSVTFGQVAEMERVIVTGSNIPTAAETGPNPVDSYRPADLEKLGIRNAQKIRRLLPAALRTATTNRLPRSKVASGTSS